MNKDIPVLFAEINRKMSLAKIGASNKAKKLIDSAIEDLITLAKLKKTDR